MNVVRTRRVAARMRRCLITSPRMSVAQKRFMEKCGLESRSARTLNQHNRGSGRPFGTGRSLCSWFFVNTNYVFDIRMDIAAMPARGGVTGSQRLRDELLAASATARSRCGSPRTGHGSRSKALESGCVRASSSTRWCKPTSPQPVLAPGPFSKADRSDTMCSPR